MGVSAAAGATAVAWAWHARRAARRTRERLHERFAVEQPLAEDVVRARSPVTVRWRWTPPAAGIAVFAALAFLTPLGTTYAAAAAVVATVLAHIVEEQVALRRVAAVEARLADAIDLMVASLGAGAGLTDAFESAASESDGLLKRELEDVLGRIRLGEAPEDVYEDLAHRIPLETFRLFTFTLTVHSEVGGSLAPALATVGRSIRDRIEIGRKVRSQATQAQASVVGILVITWFLGVMMWRTNPEMFEEFLRHPLGSAAVAAAVVLQAVGLVWITRMARIKF
jgi:Flp pilus assembly protein TadB